jgi:hypothetical protein
MIEGSTLGFNVIHGLPNDSEVAMSTTMTELDWQAAVAMRTAATTRRQGPQGQRRHDAARRAGILFGLLLAP